MKLLHQAVRATRKRAVQASAQVRNVTELVTGLRSLQRSWKVQGRQTPPVRRPSAITVREFLTGEKQTRKQKKEALEASVRHELMVRQMQASTQIRKPAPPRAWTAAEQKVLRQLAKPSRKDKAPTLSRKVKTAPVVNVARNRLSHLPNHQRDSVMKMGNAERAQYYR